MVYGNLLLEELSNGGSLVLKTGVRKGMRVRPPPPPHMSYNRHPNTSCITCSKPIYKRPWEISKNNGRVFCSMLCYGKSNRKEKPCLVCKTPILATLNKKTCSRACANIHRTGIKYLLNRPRDKVIDQRRLKLRLLKLRGQACEICGYDRIEILHVHHKDRNRQNNEMDNLKLICPNCHYEEHHLAKSWLNNVDIDKLQF